MIYLGQHCFYTDNGLYVGEEPYREFLIWINVPYV